MFTSTVIWKQRLLCGNQILRYFQNNKCYDVERDYFEKHQQSCTKFMKNTDLKTGNLSRIALSNIWLLVQINLFSDVLGFTTLKIWNKTNYLSQNYDSSKLLFYFTDFYEGQPNKTTCYFISTTFMKASQIKHRIK